MAALRAATFCKHHHISDEQKRWRASVATTFSGSDNMVVAFCAVCAAAFTVATAPPADRSAAILHAVTTLPRLANSRATYALARLLFWTALAGLGVHRTNLTNRWCLGRRVAVYPVRRRAAAPPPTCYLHTRRCGKQLFLTQLFNNMTRQPRSMLLHSLNLLLLLHGEHQRLSLLQFSRYYNLVGEVFRHSLAWQRHAPPAIRALTTTPRLIPSDILLTRAMRICNLQTRIW